MQNETNLDSVKFFKNFCSHWKKAILVPICYGGNMLNEVMNMEKSNPYSFYVVLADGIMEIPQDSNLSWITLFYALPKELVEKRPTYLELPRNIHQLLNSKVHCKLIQSEAFLELVWDCYAWSAWQFFQVPGKGPVREPISRGKSSSLRSVTSTSSTGPLA